MTRVVLDSCCSSSCVLRAMRAEKSVGSASASSRALVCKDCVCPCVAAMASTQVRMTLLNTSCAARLQPLLWPRGSPAPRLEMGAQRQAPRVLRLELVRHQLRPEQAAGPHLGDLHEEIHAD